MERSINVEPVLEDNQDGPDIELEEVRKSALDQIQAIPVEEDGPRSIVKADYS